MIVWAAAVLAALGVISKVPLWRSRSGDRVTIGKLVGRLFRYLFADPAGRWFGGVTQEAVAPLIDTMRDENTVQHAETSARLSAVEVRLAAVEGRLDAVESVVNPTGALDALTAQLVEMAETVRADRHAARADLSALNGQVQLLTTMLTERRDETTGS